MSACKFDRDANDYLVDGEPCRRDEHGDRTYHCTARRTCSQHIGRNELTCARCINDTRTNLRWIPDLAPLVLVEALNDGTHSEAAWLAGPAADYSTFTARRALDRRWIYQHIPDRHLIKALNALLEDDDELHPFNVLTRIHWDVSLTYDHPLPEVFTITGSVAYLDRNLHRIAQDPDLEFGRIRSQIKKVREHLESVIHNSTSADKGAPCPACVEAGKPAERLRRHYGHWCEDPDCEKLHYLDDSADEWVCPIDRRHRWTHRAYESWLEERTGGRTA